MKNEKLILIIIYIFSLFSFILGLVVLFCGSASADNSNIEIFETTTSAEVITEEVADVTTIEETEPPADETTLTDINHRLLFIIFGQFCLVGVLIGQAFSFWKW